MTFHEVRCILFSFHYFSSSLASFPKFWKDVHRTEYPESDSNSGSSAHLLLHLLLHKPHISKLSPNSTFANVTEKDTAVVFPRFPHSITAIWVPLKAICTVHSVPWGERKGGGNEDMTWICLKPQVSHHMLCILVHSSSFLCYLIHFHFIFKMRCSNSLWIARELIKFKNEAKVLWMRTLCLL